VASKKEINGGLMSLPKSSHDAIKGKDFNHLIIEPPALPEESLQEFEVNYS